MKKNSLSRFKLIVREAVPRLRPQDWRKIALNISGILFFALLGFFLGKYSWLQGSETRKSKFWPHTNGIIIEAEYRDNRRSMNKVAINLGKVWWAKYSYEINGKHYFSSVNRLFETPPAFDNKKHQVGTKVTVYYDPSEPSNAALEPGLQLQNYWTFLIYQVIILIVCGAVIWVFFLNIEAILSWRMPHQTNDETENDESGSHL